MPELIVCKHLVQKRNEGGVQHAHDVAISLLVAFLRIGPLFTKQRDGVRLTGFDAFLNSVGVRQSSYVPHLNFLSCTSRFMRAQVGRPISRAHTHLKFACESH